MTTYPYPKCSRCGRLAQPHQIKCDACKRKDDEKNLRLADEANQQSMNIALAAIILPMIFD